MKKNVASQVVGAQLVSTTNGSAITSGTTTCYVTGDGGSQAAGSVSSGACTHKGNGYWEYAPAQAETNYDHVAFTFVNSSAVNATVQIYTSFPQTGDNYGRLGAPAGASFSADVAAVQSRLDVLPATVFTTQTPATTNNDGAVPLELGMRFHVASDGLITALRYWRVTTDSTSSHTVNLWNFDSGTLLGSVVLGAGSGSGWQIGRLATPVRVVPGINYAVSVNYAPSSDFPQTSNVFTSPGGATDIRSGGLTATQTCYAETEGAFPSNDDDDNYWSDVVYEPTAYEYAEPDIAAIKAQTDRLGFTPAVELTLGETSSFGSATHDEGFIVAARKITVPTGGATLQSLATIITTAAGNGRLALYDASNAGKPGALIVATASQALVTGTNTWPLPPVAVPAGDYWIAYQFDDAGYRFTQHTGGPSGDSWYVVSSYVDFPATFDTNPTGDTVYYPVSANFSTSRVDASPTSAAIADAVWDEATADHQTSGTTGKALTSASSAGDPWSSELETGFTAGDLIRLLAAKNLGKTIIVNLGNHRAQVTFRAVDDSEDRIVGVVDGSERESVTLTP